MKRLSYEDCVQKGLLRQVPASLEKAKGSMRKAGRFLEGGRKNFEMDIFDGSVILAYLALFHAARAVLLKDGCREKSHACISRYLERFYARKISRKYILLLDRYRNLRHADQYDVSFYATRADAEEMLAFAGEFIGIIEGVLRP